MKKNYIIITCFLLFVGTTDAETDISGEFSFALIDGWRANNVGAKHSNLTNYHSKDDFKGNILFDDELSNDSLHKLKKD